MAATSTDSSSWKAAADGLLFAPGTPVPSSEAATIWREVAMGHWEVVAACDANGMRHVALKPAPSKASIDWSRLTERERRVLALVALGHAQMVIAMKLRLSPTTVSAAFRSARDRLGFGSSSELVRMCQGAGEAIDEPGEPRRGCALEDEPEEH
jgi:DNA-binding CsgD family transcriptional regulator